MNKVVLVGRLTRNPELKYLPGTGKPVATFTIAADRKMLNKDGQREADFIPIVVWGKSAEATANYVSKGKLIGISGRIQTRSYDAKDGSKRYVTEVVADEVQFLEWDNAGQANEGTPHESYEDYMTPVDDGSIPF